VLFGTTNPVLFDSTSNGKARDEVFVPAAYIGTPLKYPTIVATGVLSWIFGMNRYELLLVLYTLPTPTTAVGDGEVVVVTVLVVMVLPVVVTGIVIVCWIDELPLGGATGFTMVVEGGVVIE
jgi:hypothetical protein